VGGVLVPSVTYGVGPLEESTTARYVFVAPEGRLSRRLGKHLEVSADARILVLVAATQPEWPQDVPVYTGDCGTAPSPGCVTDGAGYFEPEKLAGTVMVAFSVGLGLRYDF
jgi:hypothetical protein